MKDSVKYLAKSGDRTWEIEVCGQPPEYVVRVDGRELPVNVRELGDASLLSLLVDRASCLAHVIATDSQPDSWDVSIGGKFVRLEVLDELASMAKQMQAAEASGRFVLAAPMPGLIVDVKVKPGDRVELGAPLIVMEAMKMQNELASEVAGTVAEVRAQAQQAVESGTALVVIDGD